MMVEKKLDVEKLKKAELVTKITTKTVVFAFLIFMAIVIIIPFYWMIFTGLKDAEEVLAYPPSIYLPFNELHFENFINAIIPSRGHTSFDILTLFKNTIIVAVIQMVGTLITTILAAFAFAKLHFKGRDTIFAMFLATMMIPGEMMVITNYLTVADLGWLGSYSGVITAMTVPFFISTLYIFLLRQNFMQIPNELYLAAKVDGKSDFLYLIKVLVPLSKPTITTIIILKIMGTWNSYAWPNLVADYSEWRLITNGLRTSFSNADTGMTSTHLQMAATFMVTLPLLIMFLCFRKYIMQGVSRSGIKG